MALSSPFLFGVALAAGGTGGQVPTAGDVHPIVATLASSFCSVCFGRSADTVPDPPPRPNPTNSSPLLFFCSVFHSGHRRSASNTGGTPQRSKCVKCAWNEKNKFWIRGESTCRVCVVTSVYVQVPFMKIKLVLKKKKNMKKIHCNKVHFKMARLNPEQLPRTECTQVFDLTHKNRRQNNSFQLVRVNIDSLFCFPRSDEQSSPRTISVLIQIITYILS